MRGQRRSGKHSCSGIPGEGKTADKHAYLRWDAYANCAKRKRPPEARPSHDRAGRWPPTHGPPLGSPWSRRHPSACERPVRRAKEPDQSTAAAHASRRVYRDAPPSQAAAERGCRSPLPCRAGAGITNPRTLERVSPRPVGLIAVLEVADAEASIRLRAWYNGWAVTGCQTGAPAF